jgi:O-antigen/teichoic acid export membrane protein
VAEAAAVGTTGGGTLEDVVDINASATAELRRSFVWRTLAAGGGMVSTLLLTAIIVRSLEPIDAATFFAILAALSFGPKIACFGMGPNLIRLMAAEPDHVARRGIAHAHLYITFVLACLSSPLIAVIGCIGMRGQSEFVPVVILTSILLVIESTRLMLSDILAAAGRVGASVLSMHYVRSLLVLPCVAGALMFVSKPSLLGVLATYLVVAVAQFGLALVQARHDVDLFKLSVDLSTLREATAGGYLLVLDISEFLVMQGTIWLATATFTPIAATQYAAALTLAMQVTVLESLSALAISAPASRLWAAGKKAEVVRMLSNVATLNLYFVLAVVGFLAIFGPLALEIAYGPSLRPAAAMLLIVAVGGGVSSALKRNITLLIISGHITETARTGLWISLVAIPAALAAGLLSGPIALAIVTSVSVSAMSIGQYFTARRILGFAPHAHWNALRAARELKHPATMADS